MLGIIFSLPTSNLHDRFQVAQKAAGQRQGWWAAVPRQARMEGEDSDMLSQRCCQAHAAT